MRHFHRHHAKRFTFTFMPVGILALVLMVTLPDLQTYSSRSRSSDALDRRVIALYEDLNTSQDFTTILYPSSPKPHVHFTPMVSERDCNRLELLKPVVRKNVMIIWGHIRTVIPVEQQIQHCLSAMAENENPIRHEVPEQPLFVAHAKNAHINSNGVVQTASETLVFKRSCFGSSKVKNWIGSLEVKNTNISNCTVRVENLFVASQWWGSETGHFTTETLPRILSYMDLAQRMPVHLWGEDTGQIRAWLNHLNITAIRGNDICAKNVYVASPADCRGGAFMSNMHLRAREIANPLAGVSSSVAREVKEQESNKTHFINGNMVLILHRDNDVPGREPMRLRINQLVKTMQMAGYSNIKVVNASDTDFWSCIECQMQVFRNTWLFISSHGAGLFNLLFMPVGTYVVEIASLHRPEEPYYSSAGQMTYSLGQHYYHYYWQNKEVDAKELDVDFFVDELQVFAPPHKQHTYAHKEVI